MEEFAFLAPEYNCPYTYMGREYHNIWDFCSIESLPDELSKRIAMLEGAVERESILYSRDDNAVINLMPLAYYVRFTQNPMMFRLCSVTIDAITDRIFNLPSRRTMITLIMSSKCLANEIRDMSTDFVSTDSAPDRTNNADYVRGEEHKFTMSSYPEVFNDGYTLLGEQVSVQICKAFGCERASKYERGPLVYGSWLISEGTVLTCYGIHPRISNVFLNLPYSQAEATVLANDILEQYQYSNPLVTFRRPCVAITKSGVQIIGRAGELVHHYNPDNSSARIIHTAGTAIRFMISSGNCTTFYDITMDTLQLMSNYSTNANWTKESLALYATGCIKDYKLQVSSIGSVTTNSRLEDIASLYSELRKSIVSMVDNSEIISVLDTLKCVHTVDWHCHV